MTRIRQAVSSASLFGVLSGWLTDGAGRSDCELQILSAFATGKAVRALEPLLDVFLADGNAIRAIVGIDRNGTDQSAITRLASLRAAYPNQFHAQVFHAPSKVGIFHPKLFLLHQGRSISAVLGSGNWTIGGLASNFESLFLYDNLPNKSPEAIELMATWQLYAHPKPPLKRRFLHQLTLSYAKILSRRLPVTTPWEPKGERGTSTNLWHPISRVILPRTQAPVTPRHRTQLRKRPAALLLVDILKETRSTQMQIPLSIVEDFFGIKRDEPATIELSVATSEGFGQPIERPIVISQGASGQRLMRRLEMPSIRGLRRPLAAIFFRLKRPRRRFAFRLLPAGTNFYRKGNGILARYGQQGNQDRRFVIADSRHVAFSQIHKLLKSW